MSQRIRRLLQQNRVAAILFLAAIIIQLSATVFLIWHEGRIGHYSAAGIHFPVFEGDSRRYMSLALNTIRYGKFSVSPEYYVPVDSAMLYRQFLPESYLTIGYPLFLMFALLFFRSFLAITFLQIILSGVGVVLVYELACFVLPKNWSILPAALFASDPTFILQSVIIRNDAFASVFFLGAVYLFLRFARSQEPAHLRLLFFSGLLLGYAALTRPINQWTLLLFLLFLPFFSLKRKLFSWRRYAAAAATLVVGLGVFVAPWMIRNRLTFHSWSLSSASEWTMMVDAGQFLEAEQNLRPGAILGPWLERAGTPGFLPNEIKKEVWPVIFGDPFRYAKFHLFKSATTFFFNDGLREIVFSLRLSWVRGFDDNLSNLLYNREFRALWRAIYKHRASAVLLLTGALFWGSTTLFMLVGVIASFLRKRRRLLACFYLSFIGYFAFFTGAAFTPRQRIPATPFLYILATTGIYCMIRTMQKYGGQQRAN